MHKTIRRLVALWHGFCWFLCSYIYFNSDTYKNHVKKNSRTQPKKFWCFGKRLLLCKIPKWQQKYVRKYRSKKMYLFIFLIMLPKHVHMNEKIRVTLKWIISFTLKHIFTYLTQLPKCLWEFWRGGNCTFENLEEVPTFLCKPSFVNLL